MKVLIFLVLVIIIIVIMIGGLYLILRESGRNIRMNKDAKTMSTRDWLEKYS